MQQQQSLSFDLRSLTLVVIAGAWLTGMFLESIITLPILALMVGASTSLLFVFPLRHSPQSRLIMLLIACLFLGAYRCYTVASPVNDPQVISNFIGEKVALIGTIDEEPKVHGRSRTVVVTVTRIQRSANSPWQNADGHLSVQTPGTDIEDPYGANFGDSVEVQGKLEIPQPTSPPSVFASMAFPRISVQNNQGNPIIAFFYHLRVSLATILTQVLPQPEAALLIALLLSLRTPALKPLIAAFNATGCAHLIAPSGFKVTIMAGLVISSTKRLYEKQKPRGRLLPAQKRGDWRKALATTLVVASIIVYTLLSGAGPAAIRAGIMGVLLVVAPRIGRIYNIHTALALAALVMSALDPFILWDAGFLLSFVGTLGIVLLTPFFQRSLRMLERLPFGTHFTEIFAVTLAAQTATLPLFAVDFHEVSFIAPLTNMLTVPLLGLLLMLGVFICVAGLLYLPLAVLLAWVAWPFLFYMQTIVSWCLTIPLAYLNIGSINSSVAWIYYALLALATYVIQQRQSRLAKVAVHGHTQQTHWSPRTKLIVQVCIALLIILATGTTALATRPNTHLTVAFLDLDPLINLRRGRLFLSVLLMPKQFLLMVDRMRLRSHRN